MPTNYPSGLDSFTTHHDGVNEAILAADINKIQDAVAALETTLGTNPTTAGGDLTGTLPAPTVAKVNGVAVSGAPASAGQVLAATGTTAAAWSNAAVVVDGGNATSTFAPVAVGTSYMSTAQIAADPALTSVYASIAATPSLTAFNTLSAQTATLEELCWSFTFSAAVSATQETYLGPVVFDQRVGAFSYVTSSTVAASDTDYWTLALVRRRAGGTAVTLASKTTKTTGGEAMTANVAWTFDNVSWPSILRYLKKDDVLSITLTKTGAPTGLFNGALTVRYEPNVAPTVYDTFTRADGNSLGTADTGQAWVVPNVPTGTQSVFGIVSSQAMVHVAVGSIRDYAWINSGLADCSVSAKVLDVSKAGLLVRGSQTVAFYINGYLHNSTTLFRADGNGVLTSIGALSSALANGDTVTITCSGSLITVYKNGASVLAVTDTTYTTQTYHGLRSTSPTVDTALWDDFGITA